MTEKLLENINRAMAIKKGIVESEKGEEVPYEMIDEKLRNPETFAHRIKNNGELAELEENILLNSKTIELGDKNFTNFHDLSFRSDDPALEVRVITLQSPRYPHHILRNEKYKDIIACINGAFFFLHDGDNGRDPKEIAYNLNIRDGQIIGLPATDRPALFETRDGKIHGREMIARGTIMIGDQQIEWVGGEPFIHKKNGQPLRVYDHNKAETVLFNAACCTIAYEDPNDKKSLRKVKYELNTTPHRANATDIGVSPDKNGVLRVNLIKPGGNTDFFSAYFILQIPNEKAAHIAIGDKVEPKTLDGIALGEVESASTVGPLVNHFLNHEDHDVNYDSSLGTFPPFAANARYARSVMYEDAKGLIHMAVFDGVPNSKHMLGVTPQEAAQHIPQDTRWAVFLDGGQSSRLTFRYNKNTLKNPNLGNEIDSRGNDQYVRLHKQDKTGHMALAGQRYLWSNHGRPLPVNIVLERKKK